MVFYITRGKEAMPEFFHDIGFDEKQIGFLKKCYSVFKKETEIQKFEYIKSKLFDSAVDIFDFRKDLAELAGKSTLRQETYFLLFFLLCLPKLYSDYKENNIDEKLFYDFLKDFGYKNNENIEKNNVIGIDCPEWYCSFFRLKNFSLGRFQYEESEFLCDEYSRCNVSLKKGDPVYNLHIPSCGKMNKETRYESYKQAYDFFQKREGFSDGVMKIVCHSWLLYPPYVNIFMEKSNLKEFANEFTFLFSTEKEEFADGWRIFGGRYNSNHINLPQETSLQKAFVKYLNSNFKHGIGYGILFFDGNKII